MKPSALMWHKALQEAADWYVRLDDAPHDEAQRVAWQHWLHCQPLNRAAWEKINDVGQRFAGLGGQMHPVPAAVGLRRAATLGRRLLTLHQGEVVVETAHDSAKPFIVETGLGSKRALGTVFLVRKQVGRVHLAVLEGAVELSLNRSLERRVVEQGRQVDFVEGGIGDDRALNQAQAAWRHGVLAVDAMRLEDFLAELSRYRRGYLGVHPEVADLKVMGAYPVFDTDAALSLLAEALPVRIERRLSWWVTVEPK